MRQWLAADFVTGKITGDLAAFEPQYPIRHTLSNYDTAVGTLYLAEAAPDWRNIVRAGATVVAAYDDADPTEAIQWAAYVNKVQPGNAAGTATLSLCTAEGYLRRRFVGDVTYDTTWHRNDVVEDLVANWVATTNPPGVPMQVVKIGGSGPQLPATRVMNNADNATVLQRITDLVSWLGGEWSITWERSSDRTSLVPTLYIGDQIGRVSSTGIPTVTFDQPGPVVSVDLPTDYSEGMGGNVIVAYSSGQGSVTPYADPVQAADFQGRPAFEYRYQPEPSQPDTAVLAQHAEQALNVLQHGAQPLSLTLATEGDNRLMTGRILGADWGLGDSVGYSIDPDVAFPDGLYGVARVIAVDLDVATITPIFAQPEVYVQGA